MKKIHYGWVICFACALLLFCTSGLSINAFTIYQPYIMEYNSFTNAQSSLMIMMRNLFSFGAMLLVQPYYRLFSKRNGMALAGALMVVAFALYGFANQFWMYCLASAISGISYGFGTMIPITIVLNEWFVEKKTLAFGICSAVTGLSTLGIPSLLAASVEKIGLQKTFWIETLVIAALVFLSWLLLRNHPQEMGLLPYGVKKEETVPKRPSVGLVKKDWVTLLPAILLVGAVMNVSYSHFTVHMTSAGFTPKEAAVAMAISGAVLTCSKIAYGKLSEYLTNYYCNLGFFACILVGMVAFCFISQYRVLLYVATTLMSGGLAATAIGLSAWASDFSTEKDFDKNVQRFQLLYAGGALLFSPVPGILADYFGGSYVPMFILFLVFALYLFITVQSTYIKIRKRRAKA